MAVNTKMVGAALLGVWAVVVAVRPLAALVDLLAGVLPLGSVLVHLALLALGVGLLLHRQPVALVSPQGKAVFITGCDSGFGHALAVRLDALGFRVFAGCLGPDREGARQLREATSARLHVVPLDVTDDWQVQQALEYVTEHTVPEELWAVVNNAGVATFTEIEWCSVDQFQRMLDVNVLGVVRVTKAFLPLLRQAKGRVINVASLAGRFTLPAFAAYSMSKKACIGFSDALRLEMKKFDVSVITIEPGLYRTPIAEESYLIDLNRKSWAETPVTVKEDYGEEYFQAFLKNITHQMKRARPNVTEVVDLMVKAVCAVAPTHRYVPYWRSYLRSLFLGNCPAAVTDKIFQGTMVKVPPSAKTRLSNKSSSSGVSSSSAPSTPQVFPDAPAFPPAADAEQHATNGQVPS